MNTSPLPNCASCGLAFTPRAEGQRVCSITCSVDLTRKARAARGERRGRPCKVVEEAPGPGSIGEALVEVRESVARLRAEGRKRAS